MATITLTTTTTTQTTDTSQTLHLKSSLAEQVNALVKKMNGFSSFSDQEKLKIQEFLVKLTELNQNIGANKEKIAFHIAKLICEVIDEAICREPDQSIEDALNDLKGELRKMAAPFLKKGQTLDDLVDAHLSYLEKEKKKEEKLKQTEAYFEFKTAQLNFQANMVAQQQQTAFSQVQQALLNFNDEGEKKSEDLQSKVDATTEKMKKVTQELEQTVTTAEPLGDRMKNAQDTYQARLKAAMDLLKKV